MGQFQSGRSTFTKTDRRCNRATCWTEFTASQPPPLKLQVSAKENPIEEAGKEVALAVDAVTLPLAGAGLAKSMAIMAAKGAAKELSKEALRGIRSLEKQIAQHEAKLANFKANPTVRPGMESQPKEVIEAAQQSRIRHLENEIQTFKDNIEKIRGDE